mgnify:CR=1 FL=1
MPKRFSGRAEKDSQRTERNNLWARVLSMVINSVLRGDVMRFFVKTLFMTSHHTIVQIKWWSKLISCYLVYCKTWKPLKPNMNPKSCVWKSSISSLQRAIHLRKLSPHEIWRCFFPCLFLRVCMLNIETMATICKSVKKCYWLQSLH